MSSADKYADSRKFIREKCAEKIDLMYGLKDIDPVFSDTLRKMVETQLDYEIDEIEKYGLLEEFMAMSDATEFIKDSVCILYPGGWGTSSTVAFMLGITDIDPMAYWLVFDPKVLKESRLYLSVPAHQRSEIRKLLLLTLASRNRLPRNSAKNSLEEKELLPGMAKTLDLDRYYDEIIECMDNTELPESLENIAGKNQNIRSFLNIEFHGVKLADIALRVQGIFEESEIPGFTFKAGPKGIKHPFPDMEDFRILEMFIYGHREFEDVSIGLEKIKEDNPDFDFSSIPFNDKATFELIGSGDVDGIPYLQCPQGQGLCRRICPRNLDEHIALISFIHNPVSTVFIDAYLSAKPSPRNIDYAHPEIGMILGETYGIMLYREQAVLIMEKLSGIPYDNAWDILKELMGKGNIELHMERFVKGCNSKCGIDRKAAFGIWEMIMSCPMSSKAYYVQKAVLTYKMAYIKANYRNSDI